MCGLLGVGCLLLDQPAFNRNRLEVERLIDSKVSEQLIGVEMDAG